MHFIPFYPFVFTPVIRMAGICLSLFSAAVFIMGVFLAIIPDHVRADECQWPVLGKDRMGDVGKIENHSQALMRWARKDIRNAVLVNIDAHDDLRWISQEKVDALKEIVRHKDWRSLAASDGAGENGLYHPGSFIYAAARLGIVREVYWIIPFPWFQPPVDLQRIQAFLLSYGFPPESVETFALDGDCCRGTIDGIALHICNPEHLPEIDEPVVLSLDADFFPALANWYGQDILGAISLFFSKLSNRRYRVRDALVAYSVNGGYCDVSRRWIGDVCSGMLTEPGLITGPYPERWLVNDLADIYRQNGQVRSLLDFTGRFLNKYPRDPGLMTYRCFALMARGDMDQAYDLACRASRLDRSYTFVLADLGQCLIDQGELDSALRFLHSAYEFYPQMNFRQKNFADAFFLAGRYDQALSYYEQFRRLNGPFPVTFMMGLTALKMGDAVQAEKWFAQGVKSLEADRRLSTDSDIDVQAIREAVRFFNRQGQPEQAHIILSHPILKPGKKEKTY